MNNLNYTFFEEIKHLDKLCSELYQDKHGITCYINEMKKVSEYNSQCVPGWKDDLQHLIRLRHIRNYLAHTEGAFNEENCTQKDIDWSQEFYSRILNQSDPLSVLYQNSKRKQQMSTVKPSRSQQQPVTLLQQGKPGILKSEGAGSSNKEKQSLKWITFYLAIIGTLLLVILGISFALQ